MISYLNEDTLGSWLEHKDEDIVVSPRKKKRTRCSSLIEVELKHEKEKEESIASSLDSSTDFLSWATSLIRKS